MAKSVHASNNTNLEIWIAIRKELFDEFLDWYYKKSGTYGHGESLNVDPETLNQFSQHFNSKFLPIFFCQIIKDINCKWRNKYETILNRKVACKMLLKSTPWRLEFSPSGFENAWRVIFGDISPNSPELSEINFEVLIGKVTIWAHKGTFK